MKFGSYTSAYSNPNELRRCFSSLQDKVDVMICHFGPYSDYDNSGILKERFLEAYDVAQDYDAVFFQNLNPLPEYLKRSFASVIAETLELDFLIIIDSDEYIDKTQTNWNKFKETAIDLAITKYQGCYNIFSCLVEYGNQTYKALPRVWYNPHQVRYNKTHFALTSTNEKCPYRNDPQYSERYPSKEMIPHLVIRSSYDMRSSVENNRHGNYLNILRNRESVFSNDDRFM
jgi:hypothetical protein